MRPRHLVAIPIICVGAIVHAAGRAPADKPAFSFPRSTPEAQGISSSAILAFVEEAEQKLDALHSVMIVRHGQVVAEGWWKPYAANEPHMMFSLSKSFTSTAVGLAVADGKLSVEDPVLKFFPDEAPAEPSANLKAMRVRDLLTMSAGHHDEDIRNFPYNADDSVVRRFLALPVSHKPGTFFLYNTPASYMLSAIVQKVTGQSVLEYLKPRLFEPLGITNPTWDASKQGVSMGGFGLNVRTEDIARFGQLYLQKGKWQGRQLVPAAWVETATSRLMSNGSSPTSDWEQGYGYQFWQARHGFYRGDGAHGQYCLVLPQYDTVIAITSGTRDMGSVMNHVWDRLVPALKPAALPADAAAHRKLTAKLASLTLALPGSTTTATSMTSTTGAAATGAASTAASSAIAKSVVGKRYAFDPPAAPVGAATAPSPANAPSQAIESLVVDAADAAGNMTVTMRTAGADQQFAATAGSWRTASIAAANGGTPDAIAASGAWTTADTYTLKIARYRTPFVTTYRLRFSNDQLELEREFNVGAPETRITKFAGRSTSATATRQ